jgi:hypothetical protein
MRGRLPTVGVMAAGGEGPVERFESGMREHNFIEGQNILFETRVRTEQQEDWPALRRSSFIGVLILSP